MGWRLVDFPLASDVKAWRRSTAGIVGVIALGLTGLTGEWAGVHVRLGAQIAPVPVFVFTSSKDSSIEEYLIDEFAKELPKKTKDFSFTLVNSRERARVVLEIRSVGEFCGISMSDRMVGVVGTLTVGAFSAPIQAGGSCLSNKSSRYRALGKKLAGALAKWGKEHREDLASPSEVAGSFVGRYGYRIEIPADYRAYPAIGDGEAEVLFFAPSGTELTPDESQYAERRIVRLEAWKKSTMGFRAMRQAVSGSLDESRETYTVSDVDVGHPAFLVHITKPKEIRQLVVEGMQTIFMFTGADEEQLFSLARGIK